MNAAAANHLVVWHERRRVGQLQRDDSGRMAFAYDPEWRARGGFAISHSMPLSQAEFSAASGLAHRWFANLLPEEAVRQRLVRDLKLPDTDFDLLRAIGGECAGALSILPTDREPTRKPAYEPLDAPALERLALRRGSINFNAPESSRPRLSLAGAQDKCPVRIDDGQFLMPQGEAPSSHILKFELPDYRHVPAYETFLSRLARAVDLPAVDIELRRCGECVFAVIERYDRQYSRHQTIKRLHQEDFCQALGYAHRNKYQEHDGPDFAQCCALVRAASAEPAIDLTQLLRWQIFNVLAGNSDGHAKNLALLHQPEGGVRLAPFYDLVCTRAIDRIDQRLALDVGGERVPGLIQARHWEMMARDCGVQPRFLQRLVNEMTTTLTEALRPTREEFEAIYGPYPALQRVEAVVKKQCQRVPFFGK